MCITRQLLIRELERHAAEHEARSNAHDMEGGHAQLRDIENDKAEILKEAAGIILEDEAKNGPTP
jgi:hypothetical protein